jgi:hypothetical protein
MEPPLTPSGGSRPNVMGKRTSQRGDSKLGTAAAIVTIIGFVLGLPITLIQLGVLGNVRIPGLPGSAVSASLSLSTGTGPSGTEISLSGTGFDGGEAVEIRFHTDAMATAQADGAGAFSGIRARIPGTFDAFAPQQFDIIAVGRSSSRSARATFELTRVPGVTSTPTLSTSRGSGPSGTVIMLSGAGFSGGEVVDIRFQTEAIATAQADTSGAFSGVQARIPGSFDAFAPQQFEIVAVGRSSARSAQVPFTLTR